MIIYGCATLKVSIPYWYNKTCTYLEYGLPTSELVNDMEISLVFLLKHTKNNFV